MSIRCWLYALALGGCLTGNPLAYAQDSEQKPLSTVEDSEGASVQSPAPNGDGGESADSERAAAQEAPAPSTIAVNSPPEEESCGPSCQAAQQREKDDLAAQQSMAASTVEIANLTLWQAVIGAAGLVLLGFTLYLTRESLAEARRATEAAEDSLEAMREQTRAYLSPKDVEFTFRSQKPHMKLRMLNTGSTGTRETRHLAWIYFSDGISSPKDEKIRADQNELAAQYFAGAPDDQGWKFDFSADLIPSNKWDTHVRYTVHISMHAMYRDVFGICRWQRFVYSCSGKTILNKASTPVKMRPVHSWTGACDDEKAETEKAFREL